MTPYSECINGNNYWYLNGKRHREDGPAIEYTNGYKSWYLNDKRHRKDGPAVEWDNGDKSWYLNGIKMTEQEFLSKTKQPKTIIIDGVTYTLTEVL